MNRKQLKLFAVACMLFDHVVRIFPLYRLFTPLSDALWAAGWEAASDWVLEDLSFCLMFIGRLAAPVFVYGIAVGFLHTHDVKRYLRRLLVTLADNGKPGRAGRAFQYGMYAFYPLHFAVLALTGFLLPPLA